jgi:tetratricopeptide (TPR) repeat protein
VTRKLSPIGAAAFLAFLALRCAASRTAQPPSVAAAGEPEAVSLLGEPLFAPAIAPERRAELEARLAEAREALEKNPGDPDAIIWLGRRTAYLGRFRDAVAIFSDGIARHPADPRLYRHRGHRYITLRRFDLAEADLERAASLVEGAADEVEPDGIPNARNVPTSTLQSNIWYHLGLARYLQGDFGGARTAYRRGMEVSKNADTVVAMTHWLYMTLRRLGREQEAAAALAPIADGMDVIENGDYYRLLRMYQGKLEPGTLLAEAGEPGSVASATVGYGVGHWYLYNGRAAEALRRFREVLRAGQWPAFGHVASEAEGKRLGATADSQP